MFLGVRVSKGQEEIDITAPIVISAAGVINTFKTLLPKQVAEKTGTILALNFDFKVCLVISKAIASV